MNKEDSGDEAGLTVIACSAKLYADREKTVPPPLFCFICYTAYFK